MIVFTASRSFNFNDVIIISINGRFLPRAAWLRRGSAIIATQSRARMRATANKQAGRKTSKAQKVKIKKQESKQERKKKENEIKAVTGKAVDNLTKKRQANCR